MKKVLIPTNLDAVAADILKANASYTIVQDAKTPFDELIKAHPDTYALIVRSEKVTAERIDRLPQLRVVVRAGAGFDTIDIKYARKRDVDVMNTPGANSNAVAEQVIALILADARFIIPADISTRRGEWEKKAFMGRELSGKTVGIVGLGNVGRLVAKRLKGFECRLLGFDPLIQAERVRESGIEPVTLDELFREADYVTLHIPGGEGTKNLVGHQLLSLMKTGATLVNCARAGIIDEAALRDLKEAKKLRFLNDVYPKDEPGPKPLADIADIMLPHLGANTHEANHAAAERAARELIDLDEKGVTSYIVNRDIPEGLDRTYCSLAFTLAHVTRDLAGRKLPIRKIETSFYGRLEPYAQWLLVPILSGMCEDFDRYNDYRAAVAFIDEVGIEYVNRPTDADKGFANSITIDLVVEQAENQLKRTSVRGTVAEGVIMVSRIDEFDQLYFVPGGVTLFFLYDDRPGVIAAISRKLADAGFNIEDIRNPHDLRTNRSLAIFKLYEKVPAELIRTIGHDIKAHLAICTNL